ncbi:claudin-4-like [Erythrolamprus reginae]|uniref:claudin-4-like n=1 Tax=Erythrolamprus reginae TaxID=121349 RepID=UPI00396C91AE
MAALALQLVGLALSILGWLGSILACALPMWKVTAFIGSNIIVAQVFWEGLWMNCVYESTGQMQCKVYDSLLDLPADLQTSRALVVVSIALSFLALLIAVSGARCTRFVEDSNTKAKVLKVAGVVFVLAGTALLFPVSWSARNIVSNFYNPLVPEALKRELGLSLYIGWAASAFLILGGGTFCCFIPPKEDNTSYPMRYWTGRQPSASSYARKDYV